VSLRVALLCAAPRPQAAALAAGLAAAGHRPARVAPPAVLRLLDAGLGLRRYEPGAAAVPWLARAAARRAPDAAHAFSIAEAAAAARSGRPALWSVLGPVGRGDLSARRSTFALLREGLAGCTLLAADAEVAASLARWLGVQAPVVAPADLPARLPGLLRTPRGTPSP